MSQLVFASALSSIHETFEPGLQPGVAFVPCAMCNAPVDLAGLGGVEQRPLCDRHRPRLVLVGPA